MRKAFTLLEVVISVTIFLIVLIFMYKVLDDTKLSNEKFVKQVKKSQDGNFIYKIFAEDIAEQTGEITTSIDKNKNSMMIFKTKNSYNNPFYQNVTYLISSKNNLLRIESKDKFLKEKAEDDFYKNSFIDVLVEDVTKFNVLIKDDKIIFIIESKNREKIIFSTFKMES